MDETEEAIFKIEENDEKLYDLDRVVDSKGMTLDKTVSNLENLKSMVATTNQRFTEKEETVVMLEHCSAPVERYRGNGEDETHFKLESFPETHSFNGTTFKCEQCPKSFRDSTALAVHVKIHTGEKLHKCGFCEKAFQTARGLSYHRKSTFDIQHTHTGEGPFKCKQCPKSFKDARTLVDHYRVHKEEKLYKCDLCSKAFLHSSSMYRHRRGHTEARLFKCEVCPKTFKDSSFLIDHVKTHMSEMGEKPYQCDQFLVLNDELEESHLD